MLGTGAQDIEIFHRHRGIYDADRVDNAFYVARPMSAWDKYVRIIVKVSGASTATVSWGDAENTTQAYSLTVAGFNNTGFNYLDFPYTSAIDCEPENPNDPIGDHIPPLKKISIRFDNPDIVYELSFNMAEISHFTTGQFQELNLSFFNCSGQLLTNLPVFNAGLQLLNVGGEIPGYANPVYQGALPFSEIRNSLVFALQDIQTLNLGISSTATINGYINDVPYQVADLTGMSSLREIFLHGNRVHKIITDQANNLEKLWNWGSLEVRDYLDVSQFYISPTVKDLRLGNTNFKRSESLFQPLQLQSTRDIEYLNLHSCFMGNGDGTIPISVINAALATTIDNLYAARHNHTATTKTLVLGNDVVSVNTHNQLQDLINNYNWTITYNQPV